MASQTHSTNAPHNHKLSLREQLCWLDLTHCELDALTYMLDTGDREGQFLYISIPRIAAFTRWSRRAVQHALHGDPRKCTNCKCPPPRPAPAGRHQRPWNHKGSLCGRMILETLAFANETTKKATIYRLHSELIPVSENLVKASIAKRWIIPQPIIDRCDSNLRETMQQLLQFTPPRDAGDPSSPIRLLADRLARQTGLAMTESFLTVIALSIRAEASIQRTSLQRAALSIEQHMATSHPVDRFYFEDCKWRAHPGYNQPS